MQFCCENSRRLTGANLFTNQCGAVLDLVYIDGEGQKKLGDIAASWTTHAASLLQAVGWANETVFQRPYDRGISLGITAPLDCLYSAADLCESALLLAADEQRLEISGIEVEQQANLDILSGYLKGLISEEVNPALLELETSAKENNCLFLHDDDHISLGSGKDCQIWPVTELPDPSQINWKDLSAIPLALITGTNGKSTSVRLASAIASAASLSVGTTSTDYIKVGDEIIDRGDYSGPGGARTLLRDKRVDLAILELARGGMLRRGLGVPSARAALITNVAADHLGDYGINTVAELIEAKFIVRKALSSTSPLILNADDPGIVEFAESLEQKIIWFSEDPDNEVLSRHINDAGEAVSIKEGYITYLHRDHSTTIVELEKIPVTMSGHARHNVQNALGVSALCSALGIHHQFIKEGLLGFSGNVDDNPGRGNLFERDGIKILIDFAHNEHGMNALASMAGNIESNRRLILMGQAGDRSDDAIIDLVVAAMQASPDRLIASETPGYERGRAAHETAELIENTAKKHGLDADSIVRCEDPATGVKSALQWAKPGDFLMFIILTNRDEVIQLVQDFVAQSEVI